MYNTDKNRFIKKDKAFQLRKVNSSYAFTIVELLIVIVIIGILTAITIVSYTGITKRATEATFISDLTTAKKQFALYYVDHGVYPTGLINNCPTNAAVIPADTNYCLKSSSGNIFAVTGSGSSYALTATKGTTIYSVTNDSSPIAGNGGPTNCPTGFVLVPGSATYGTSNFCVMKYEAKADDNGDGVGDTTYTTGSNTWPADTYPISASRKLVSTPGGYPVANISQTTAITAAASFTKDCTGCHLISEAEWMTIAQNVLGVGNNWSNGTVGSGFIYSGHNDYTPGNVLVAVVNDDDGYNGTGQANGSNQRRTLALSNGNVIWDLAGNTYDWSAGQVSSAIQPGVVGNTYTSWLEWPAVTNPGSLPVNVTPASTGISGASSWNSSNGVGKIVSNPADTSSRGFLRGGYLNNSGSTGLLSLDLSLAPSGTSPFIGLRVAAPAF